ncbi:MAG: hypothetical protein J1E41_00920 [Ruminococcus sp.]|nr:hypothetical protein [Ruminococcus sp.]
MNSITDIADTLIRDAKKDSQLDDIHFLKEHTLVTYNSNDEGLTAVVNIEDVRHLKSFVSRLYKLGSYGDIFSSKLNIRLYAGSDIWGYDLIKNALILRKAIIDADSSGFIKNSSISQVKYENNSGAVYRDISFNIEYVLCEAVV